MTTLTPLERCVLREVRHGYADIDDARCNEIAYVIDRILERSRAGTDDANVGEDAAKCTVKSKKLPERERVANHPGKPDSSALTDAERTAVEGVIEDYEQDGEPASAGRVAILRALLERLGGGE